MKRDGEIVEIPEKVRERLLNDLFKISERKCLSLLDYLDIDEKYRSPKLESYGNIFLDTAYEYVITGEKGLEKELDELKQCFLDCYLSNIPDKEKMLTGEENRMTKVLNELLFIAPNMPKGINFQKINYGTISMDLSMIYSETGFHGRQRYSIIPAKMQTAIKENSEYDFIEIAARINQSPEAKQHVKEVEENVKYFDMAIKTSEKQSKFKQ